MKISITLPLRDVNIFAVGLLFVFFTLEICSTGCGANEATAFGLRILCVRWVSIFILFSSVMLFNIAIIQYSI